ncbi:hypothetical protein G3580_18010 [Nitrogeniibacter mangrovi]|uniref:Uncharacterized protein n=1 Tax=Nitrogeniibacter mangrovi TaxID=2016596 RepID=A0A6C1B7K0_9RHOO|nr:hypothetical protein [Nitrogeniibacter mangrovi]QID19343.1 hypothetical protein G3580_18010 [Nitrogeniibacter mangrovi]
MENDTAAVPVFDVLDSLVSSGGVVLLLFAGLFLVVLVAAWLFVRVDGVSSRERSRRSRAAREQERRRNRQDMALRVRGYARSRHEAVACGVESPDEAMRSMRDYGNGVVDAITCSTRNVKQIESLRTLIESESKRLDAAARAAASASSKVAP